MQYVSIAIPFQSIRRRYVCWRSRVISHEYRGNGSRIEQGIFTSWGRRDISKHVCISITDGGGEGSDPILRNEFGTQLWQFVDAGDGDGDGQNMHNFMNMNMSSSKTGDVVPSNSNTHVQTQRSVDIDMYDVND